MTMVQFADTRKPLINLGNIDNYTAFHVATGAATASGRVMELVGERPEPVVPEAPARQRFVYKGFTCIWNKEEAAFDIFTRDEMEQPRGFRNADWQAETEAQAKEWIDSY